MYMKKNDILESLGFNDTAEIYNLAPKEQHIWNIKVLFKGQQDV